MAANPLYDRRDWLGQLFQLRGSVFPQIAPKVFFLSAVSWGLMWIENHTGLPRLPMAPFTVLGTALGLLLTLRTNASYDRFWEGRKAWGAMVNRCRNFARQAAIAFQEPQSRLTAANYLCGFAHAAKRQLWGDAQVPELERLVGKKDGDRLHLAPGPAQSCLSSLGRCVSEARTRGWIDSMDQRRMEEDLTVLMDQLGACERIQRTPIPIGYVLHLRRFLTFYCLTLTLALVDPLGWCSPLIVGFVAYAFLGIERVGIEIEDPFEKTPNDIDLETITQTIERDVIATFTQQVDFSK